MSQHETEADNQLLESALLMGKMLQRQADIEKVKMFYSLIPPSIYYAASGLSPQDLAVAVWNEAIEAILKALGEG